MKKYKFTGKQHAGIATTAALGLLSITRLDERGNRQGFYF
ncbi:hypothetical protein P3T25_005054 [Paraburkholderia sp. GAS32]